jgi:hypothetical protein
MLAWQPVAFFDQAQALAFFLSISRVEAGVLSLAPPNQAVSGRASLGTESRSRSRAAGTSNLLQERGVQLPVATGHAAAAIVASKMMWSSSIIRVFARVVKLVYTAGLKPAAANHGMPVRFRSLAPRAASFAKEKPGNVVPNRAGQP